MYEKVINAGGFTILKALPSVAFHELC